MLSWNGSESAISPGESPNLISGTVVRHAAEPSVFLAPSACKTAK
jgi:hypothetical protein